MVASKNLSNGQQMTAWKGVGYFIKEDFCPLQPCKNMRDYFHLYKQTRGGGSPLRGWSVGGGRGDREHCSSVGRVPDLWLRHHGFKSHRQLNVQGVHHQLKQFQLYIICVYIFTVLLKKMLTSALQWGKPYSKSSFGVQ